MSTTPTTGGTASRLALKKTPLDTWSTREHLALASAVLRSGDQNWMSVSRAMRGFADPGRPPDWCSQKNCAQQYARLLERVDTPRRKRERGEPNDTPGESIVRRLRQDRTDELRRQVTETRAAYTALKAQIRQLRSGQLDGRLDEIQREIQAEREAEAQEQERQRQWLADREAQKLAVQQALRAQVTKAPPPKRRKLALDRRESSPSEAGSVLSEPDYADSPASEAPPADASGDDTSRDAAEQRPAPASPLLTSLLRSPSTGRPAAAAAESATPGPPAGSPALSRLLELPAGAPAHSLPRANLFPEQRPEQNGETGPADGQEAAAAEVKDEQDQEEAEVETPAPPPPPPPAAQQPEPAIEPAETSETEVKQEPAVGELTAARASTAGPGEGASAKPGADSVPVAADTVSVEKSTTAEADNLTATAAPSVTEEKAVAVAEPAQEPPAVEKPATAAPEPEPQSAAAEPKPASESTPKGVRTEPEPKPKAKPEPEQKSKTIPEPESKAKTKPEPESKAKPGPEPKLNARPEEPKSKAKPEESKLKAKPEEPKSKTKPEEPKSKAKPEEPKSKAKAEEPKSKTKLEEPKSKAKSDEPKSKAKPEDPKSKTKPASKPTPAPAEAVAPAAQRPPPASTEASAADSGGGETPAAPSATTPPAVKQEPADQEESEPTPPPPAGPTKETAPAATERPTPRPPPPPVKEERDASDVESAASAGPVSRARTFSARSEATSQESVPNSPASGVLSGDDEERRDFKLWKKSILLLWREFAGHRHASMFARPITDDQASNYSAIVRSPMDLSSLKRSVETGAVTNTAQFQRDLMLMFCNAMMFNSTDHEVYRFALEMQAECVEKLQLLTQSDQQGGAGSKRRETRESSRDELKRKRSGDERPTPTRKRR